MRHRGRLAAVAVLLCVAAGACSGGKDHNFIGQSHATMMANLGAPALTEGNPEMAGSCTWDLVGKRGEAEFHAGVPKEGEVRRGALFAAFRKGAVYWWRMVIDGEESTGGTTR